MHGLRFRARPEVPQNLGAIRGKDSSGLKADLSMFADSQLGSGDPLPGNKSRCFIARGMTPRAATVMISNPLMQEAARR